MYFDISSCHNTPLNPQGRSLPHFNSAFFISNSAFFISITSKYGASLPCRESPLFLRPATLLAARSAAGPASTYSQLTEDARKMSEAAIPDAVTAQMNLGIH